MYNTDEIIGKERTDCIGGGGDPTNLSHLWKD